MWIDPNFELPRSSFALVVGMPKRAVEDAPAPPAPRRRLSGKAAVVESDGLAARVQSVVSIASSLEKKQICENILQPLLPVFQKWEQGSPAAVAASGIAAFSLEQYCSSMSTDGSYMCTVHFHQLGLVTWLSTWTYCILLAACNTFLGSLAAVT